ncbi:MAG: arginine--tRNA ligase [Chloroflexi bacterium]|nr:arginine--tRNA ligase [Chloroflexota bacterium]
MTLRNDITIRLEAAVAEAQKQGVLPEGELPEAIVERPQNVDHGDFASSLPLRLAKAARKNPMAIAESLVPFVKIDYLVESVWAAPPGFVNFKLSATWLQSQVEAVISAGDTFGNTDTGAGKLVQVEFVSVNPTGPVHVGHARGAVLGSALARALSAAGFDVKREYYVNDAGTQMEIFYESTFLRYAQAQGSTAEEIPENGYRGQYLIDLGQALSDEFGPKFMNMERSEAVAQIGAVGLDRMLDAIGVDLARIGVGFDVWFREHSLFESGEFEEAMADLEQRGYTTEREGATWFKSTEFGEEKDNVIVRTSGQPTYFASDIAYHRNKFEARGFDRVIDIWGADHQGHVARMKAVLRALDIDDSRLTILISQLVTLKSGGDIVRASKRTGQIVTLSDLVDEVGPDACRFFFLARAAESQMEFDLELAKKESSDNPVYYVQYAHARIAGILRQAAERNVTWADGDVSLLVDNAELALVRKMLQLPELIDAIAITLAPHSLPHYAVELATAFHGFYDHCRVLSSEAADEPLMKARLRLVDAAKIALARTLDIMGMSAPETM